MTYEELKKMEPIFQHKAGKEGNNKWIGRLWWVPELNNYLFGYECVDGKANYLLSTRGLDLRMEDSMDIPDFCPFKRTGELVNVVRTYHPYYIQPIQDIMYKIMEEYG